MRTFVGTCLCMHLFLSVREGCIERTVRLHNKKEKIQVHLKRANFDTEENYNVCCWAGACNEGRCRGRGGRGVAPENNLSFHEPQNAARTGKLS